ncbi:MAG: hypothetical protein U5K54_28980 [Cytophagales bacterium]|nr:hypothetical protein [Cytophagales bacterium]
MNTGQISDLYPSLFTPAGFTFSVWSLIYLSLIGFSTTQVIVKDKPYFKELSLWFILSCISNISWILAWHHLFTAASGNYYVDFIVLTLRRFFYYSNEIISIERNGS